MNIQINNEQMMEQLGKTLAKRCPRQCVFYLNGSLGTGKTTFARGFIQGCGYTGLVKSPTYTLVEPYHTTVADIYHFDLYRLKDPQELTFIGIQDYLEQPSIWLIEWPKQGGNLLPCADLKIDILLHGQSRDIKITPSTEPGNKILGTLSTALYQ